MEFNPRLVVEASAGTGKTYTIVGLYIRLLIEKQVPLDKILVMTFTKKATAELRERIFDRLRVCRSVLMNKESINKPFFNEFLKRIDDKTDALNRIEAAIHDFDDSQVLTIHSFCQKILTDEALIAGTSFEVEFTQSDELLAQATEDFWREFIAENSGTKCGRYYIGKLQSIAESPAELRGNEGIGLLFNKPYAKIEGDRIENPIEVIEYLLSIRENMISLWDDEKNKIKKELIHSDLKGFTEKNVKSRMRKMDEFLSDSQFSNDSFDQLKYFTSEFHSNLDNLKKGKTKIPEHPYFVLCSQYKTAIEKCDSLKTTLIYDAFQDIKKRREALSIQSGLLTYDDLLTKLLNALSVQDRGKQLASKLLQRYPYALVDEFQDTDPVQYSIFDAVYPQTNTGESCLMMIGDPKQAIYAFRGADVYTYFKARDSVKEGMYSIKKNYRSTPTLIKAVNTLFNGPKMPFIEEKIEFFNSDPGFPDSADHYQVEGEIPVPLKINVTSGVSGNKENCKEFIYNHTVKEVADLLEKRGTIKIGNRSLEAGDIAILVSSHKDAAKIKNKLNDLGIDAVTYSREKVFESHEAYRIYLLMNAVLEPANQKHVRNALMSGFFGLDLFELSKFCRGDEYLRKLSDRFQILQKTWSEKGFYPMFRQVFFEDERIIEFTKLDHSERILTNLFQLAELCSKAENEQKLDPYSLYNWFCNEMKDPDKDDEKTLLLESDQNLVKISTIHGCKGLQFPVVFCPDLWEGRDSSKKMFFEYHNHSGNGQAVINIDQADNQAKSDAYQLHEMESVAEEVRKMYVAVTRAEYECRIWWSTHNQSHFSGLGASILGRERLLEAIRQKSTLKEGTELSDTLFIQAFEQMTIAAPECIGLNRIDDATARKEPVLFTGKTDKEMKFQEYSGRAELPVLKSLESFSSLVYHKSQAAEPDYDQYIENYVGAFADRNLETDREELTIFSFPRGATAGTAIHKLFEHEEFDFSSVSKMHDYSFIEEVLSNYQIDNKWAPVLSGMMKDVACAKIDSLHLDQINRKDELREMEFHFPVSKVHTDQLFEIIRNQNGVNPSENESKHFLTGFIDLIVRQNGKYYILDYKSNHLGDRIEDYDQQCLKNEIESAGYDLQYHLYTVALVKYLRNNLPGFEYEKHFGGAAYLFIRGMRAGSDQGVWFHKPKPDVIRNLEKYLDRVA
ncbi:MAG: exodeoxyribonuclease V subunit beta [Balneolaceae bacterium]